MGQRHGRDMREANTMAKEQRIRKVLELKVEEVHVQLKAQASADYKMFRVAYNNGDPTCEVVPSAGKLKMDDMSTELIRHCYPYESTGATKAAGDYFYSFTMNLMDGSVYFCGALQYDEGTFASRASGAPVFADAVHIAAGKPLAKDALVVVCTSCYIGALEKMLQSVLNGADPAKLPTRIRPAWSHGHSRGKDASKSLLQSCLPRLDYDLSVLFQCFPPDRLDTLFQVIAAMMTEQRLLFHSSDIRLLHVVSQGLQALIYPFEWCGAYSAVLPSGLQEGDPAWKLLQISTVGAGYMCGIHTSYLAEVMAFLRRERYLLEDPDSCLCIVNLDQGSMQSYPSNGVPAFPVAETTTLKRSLSQLLRSKSRAKRMDTVQQLFLEHWADLFRIHRIQDLVAQARSATIDAKSIKEKGSDTAGLVLFLQTMMFAKYADDNSVIRLLFEAVRSGDRDKLDGLPDHVYDVQHTMYKGWTVLHEAANCSGEPGTDTMLRVLVEKLRQKNIAFDLNLRDGLPSGGRTPLFLACQSNARNALYLLEEGADPNRMDAYHQTAMPILLRYLLADPSEARWKLLQELLRRMGPRSINATNAAGASAVETCIKAAATGNANAYRALDMLCNAGVSLADWALSGRGIVVLNEIFEAGQQALVLRVLQDMSADDLAHLRANAVVPLGFWSVLDRVGAGPDSDGDEGDACDSSDDV